MGHKSGEQALHLREEISAPHKRASEVHFVRDRVEAYLLSHSVSLQLLNMYLINKSYCDKSLGRCNNGQLHGTTWRDCARSMGAVEYLTCIFGTDS